MSTLIRTIVQIVLYIAFVAGPAAAQEPVIILPEADALRLVEEIRDARAAAAIVETLKAESAAKDAQIREMQAQIAELREEARKRELAMALAEDRERRRQEDDVRVQGLLDRATKTIERYERLADRQERRIEALERRQFFSGLLLPLGILAGFLAGGAAQ